MADFIFLMHEDAPVGPNAEAWGPYLQRLQALGVFEGGSAIAEGETLRKSGAAGPLARHIGGYIRVTAETLEAAKAYLDGNPVWEAGGTVEIRELPRS